jgi:CO/xanthine dehydrogenase FAD-binding subunit
LIRVADDAIHIGAAATFTDIRRSAAIAGHLPLLAQAASWTGSIANQNRGTLGGNICNASPAADSPPALLVYAASVTLVSARGQRTLPYSEFHLGYKQTALRAEELLHTISIPLQPGSHRHYIRKVGTRNAQAISKVALAATARMDGDIIADLRIAAAALMDRPFRCLQTEAALTGQPISESTIRAARAALAAETTPIDDIRSTARYRVNVAANLLEEFLRSLSGP